MKTVTIDSSFWSQKSFKALGLDEKLVYLNLLTSQNRGQSQYVNINKAQISSQIGLTEPLITQRLKQLKTLGFLDCHKDYAKLFMGCSNINNNDVPDEIINLFEATSNLATEPKPVDLVIKPEALRLSRLLAASLQANFDFIKVTDKQISQWAIDIEKINRLDGYAWSLIEAIIKWSQEDSFWKQNIRSGAKLRKQFQTLLIRVKSEVDSNKKSLVIIE